jgi:hypothetical protein
MDHTGLYIAMSIPWPQIPLQRPHDTCTKTECFANQVDDQDYKTAHADDCSDPTTCPSVYIATNRAAAILADGNIPVVRVNVKDEAHEAIELEVSFDKPYIAISHVWSHGLGNVNSNGLPRCQLLRLRRITTQLWHLEHQNTDEIPHMWIDTLCIPRGEEFLEYRKLGIIKLAETFGRATKVLALDAGLCQASVGCIRAELATRVHDYGLCHDRKIRLSQLPETMYPDPRRTRRTQFFTRKRPVHGVLLGKGNSVNHFKVPAKAPTW